MAIAMARFLKMGSARFGLAVLAVYFLLAIYAPFITNEVALLWWDENGLSLPALAELFNRNSYAKPHHLLFNCLAVLLPVYLLVWWLLGKRSWTVPKRVFSIIIFHVIVMILAWIPLAPPSVDGGDWRAFWDERPQPQQTYRQYLKLENAQDFASEEEAVTGEEYASSLPMALFPPVPHSYRTKFYAYKHPLTINPDTNRAFFWGTDDRGADVFARMLFGARISLTIGFVAVGLSMLIGIVLGAVSGYFGGWLDLLIQRIVEVMMAFPVFILVLVVIAMWGRDIYLMMIVFGLTGWAGTTRLVRGEFLAQNSRDYVMAARSLGLKKPTIMFRHILPNTLTPLLISAAFGMAGMVLAESGLAFIGLGDDSVPSWGSLLNVGRQEVSYSWIIWIPGLAIFGLVASLNLVGNALREALDPKGDV